MMHAQQIQEILTKNPTILLEILLDKNQVFKLSPEQMLILQYLWLGKTKHHQSLSHEQLADLTHLSPSVVRQAMTQLITDGYIHLITTDTAGKITEDYDLAPLVNKCFETELMQVKPTNAVYLFVEKVEHEFTRKLSSIEIQYIQSWILDEHLSLDLLEEALKETVLAGVRNFKYMSAVIHNWQQNSEKKVLSQKYQQQQERKAIRQDFSEEEKAIAKFDWERALHEDE